MGYATQAAVVVTGTPVAFGCTRSMPSSVEQKSRFPVDFGAMGAPAATNPEIIGPGLAIPVARNTNPLLPAEPGMDSASALSSRQAVSADAVQGAAPPSSARLGAYPTVGYAEI